MKHILISIVLVIGYTKLPDARVWHVPSEIPTITTAVEDSAQYSDTVLVATGMYDTTSGEVFPIDMSNGVVLFSEQGADSTIIDGDGTRRLIICDNTDSTTSIIGFTLQNGYAGGDTLIDTTFIDSCGGGILCTNNCFLTITNNIFINNTALARGGGVYSDGVSSPQIIDNIIQNNYAQSRGGGLLCSGHTQIINNIISLNSSYTGGGIACENSSTALIEENVILENQAGNGGGIASLSSSIHIINNKILANSAQNGGGVFCNSSTDTIERNIIEENSASDGAGLFLAMSNNSRIAQNVIAYNITSYQGSAITPTFSYCSITGNTIVSNFNDETDLDAVFLKDYAQEITYNAIMDNCCGVFIHNVNCSGALINNNNIYFNTYQTYDYDIRNFSIINGGIDARYNWWNTTDSTTIASYIYEYYGPGRVLFVPFLEVPEPNAPGEPSSVNSVVVMSDSTYTTPLTQPVTIGDTLCIQLEGTDWNSSYIDPAMVILTSNLDTYGIGVALIETDTATGIHRGKAYVATASYDLLNKIGVYQQDTIIVYANVDITKCDTVIVGGGDITETKSSESASRILLQNSPNPFHSSTNIRYSVTKESFISLKIYNTYGRFVETLVNTIQQPGHYIVKWNSRDKNNKKLPFGVYFLRFESESHHQIEKMVLIR